MPSARAGQHSRPPTDAALRPERKTADCASQAGQRAAPIVQLRWRTAGQRAASAPSRGERGTMVAARGDAVAHGLGQQQPTVGVGEQGVGRQPAGPAMTVVLPSLHRRSRSGRDRCQCARGTALAAADGRCASAERKTADCASQAGQRAAPIVQLRWRTAGQRAASAPSRGGTDNGGRAGDAVAHGLGQLSAIK